MSANRPSRRFLELVLIAVAFGSVYGTYLRFFDDDLPVEKTLAGCVAAVLAFWLSAQLRDSSEEENNSWAVFVEQFCFGTGLSLLAHALVTYGLLARRTPFLVVGGSLLAATLVTAARRMFWSRSRTSDLVLLVGYDDLSARLLTQMEKPVSGICGPCAISPPSGIPLLGDLRDLEEIVVRTRPTDILLGLPEWEKKVPADALLRFRLQGIRVTEAPALYEKLFLQVCCERLQPVDLALSSSLRGDARTMAIQAVYNNLIGLFFLILLAPAIFVIALTILLSTGSGPTIESTECAGFQYIPFRLQRFRTTRSDGTVTGIGAALRRFGLVNLPQLINVVRGDMALVGPRPVRSEFARNLSAAMPFYAHRFSVKPGLAGWARVHLPEVESHDTRREIEYDLYYIKESSLWLDLEILFDRIFRGRAKARRTASAVLTADEREGAA